MAPMGTINEQVMATTGPANWSVTLAFYGKQFLSLEAMSFDRHASHM